MTAQDKNALTWAQGWLAFKRQHVNPSTIPIANYLAAHRAQRKAGPKLDKLKN